MGRRPGGGPLRRLWPPHLQGASSLAVILQEELGACSCSGRSELQLLTPILRAGSEQVQLVALLDVWKGGPERPVEEGPGAGLRLPRLPQRHGSRAQPGSHSPHSQQGAKARPEQPPGQGQLQASLASPSPFGNCCRATQARNKAAALLCKQLSATAELSLGLQPLLDFPARICHKPLSKFGGALPFGNPAGPQGAPAWGCLSHTLPLPSKPGLPPLGKLTWDSTRGGRQRGSLQLSGRGGSADLPP